MAHPIDVTLPSDTEVRVTRVFDAPRRLVYECHTEPELVKRWLLGPPGWTMPVCEIDLRVGGRYRYVWRSDADGAQFGFSGEFREIAAPERIVHSERFEPGADWAGSMMDESIVTMTLTEEDGRTTLVMHMRYPTAAIRDQAVATGMTDGMAQSYDRLEEMMAERAVA
ncbi:MAG: SRPBCC family protein [Gemmatirosa sp.]